MSFLFLQTKHPLIDSGLFLSPPNITARYFRDPEVWANSEPFLGASQFEHFTNFALEAGFATGEFKINFVPGYYGELHGNNRPSWVAFSGRKKIIKTPLKHPWWV